MSKKQIDKLLAHLRTVCIDKELGSRNKVWHQIKARDNQKEMKKESRNDYKLKVTIWYFPFDLIDNGRN